MDSEAPEPRYRYWRPPRRAQPTGYPVDGDLLKFLNQFRNTPRSIGAIAPSSRQLAEAMIAPIDFKAAKVIVEFGPGTGVMTGAIVCGLPWASLPIELQARIMAAIMDVLKPGGIFVTFAYLQGLLLPAAGMLRRRLKSHFSAIKTTNIIWRNIPPAFAYICYR